MLAMPVRYNSKACHGTASEKHLQSPDRGIEIGIQLVSTSTWGGDPQQDQKGLVRGYYIQKHSQEAGRQDEGHLVGANGLHMASQLAQSALELSWLWPGRHPMSCITCRSLIRRGHMRRYYLHLHLPADTEQAQQMLYKE